MFKGLFRRRLLASCLIAVISWQLSPAISWAQVPGVTPSIQPYLDQVIENITEFTLDNGLQFIVLEDRSAPVVSFVTYADVGGVDEPDGKTGVAHFLEHLAFKGSTNLGTTNYEAEQVLLDRLDRLFDQMQQAKEAGDMAQFETLETEFQQVQAEANEYVIQNAFGQVVEAAGGVGLNAATSADYTQYFYSFPSNKLELWMSLESERFLDPVFREFYKEREVILEERRMRTDNSPIGKMVEVFLDTAFSTHPYRRPVIGYDEDIRNLTRQDIKDFFAEHYTPDNLTIAIVGDVDPTQVKAMAEVYFGRFPKAAALEEPPLPVEPPQTETRSVTLELPSQPWYLEGYHAPQLTDPDYVVYQIIASILSNGRTSRLYKSLVEEQQVALNAEGFNGFPGEKYPNIMLLYALTAPGKTVDDVAAAFAAELERLKTEPVSPEELERVKTQARASLLRSLDSNMGMARLLATYEVQTGDWRELFTELDRIAAITAEDVQRVAQETFTPENRTVGKLLSAPTE
ncbi:MULTISPECIES: M16 family metallopeptidase [unclassified Picosynechococcus]|uniref:M16 family metallopeptidase n=1 Tax=unclassified Picosynechococcus TaxID=3079910 RepID=UPI0004AB6871|nr:MULTISPECIES: pitrilysin family protein [unclassified Picosynechococcus]AMA10135.1 peptidase M16 [Picosynechococcus sp. PCC 73109]